MMTAVEAELECARREHVSTEVKVGPHQLTSSEGHVVLVTSPSGQIDSPGDHGLYFFDTRLISNWAVSANGDPWQLLNSGSLTHYAVRIFLTNRAIATEDGEITEHTIGLEIGRSIIART